MMTDPISDMLARIKNAGLRYFDGVDVPSSRIKMGILQVLEREGYINGFEQLKLEGRSILRVNLRYYEGKPVIKELDRTSKPSCRVYSKLKKIGSVHNGFGIYVLSTSKGIMSDAEAREANVGGEVLCRVF
ncbi:MAG: 30S ribosomal protein S8 [Holosporaceae bacterium]|jgi:small subunit ribosomal protein S8|nr:30S ribosomal protein S8 [Holosporaceae bacterium]